MSAADPRDVALSELHADLDAARCEIQMLRDFVALSLAADGVLVLRVPTGASFDPDHAGLAIRNVLRKNGKPNATVLILDAAASVEEIDPEIMRRNGWRRVA